MLLKFIFTTRVLFMLLGAGAAAWGFLIEPGLLRLTELRIETERWPQRRAPLRVAALGDLQIGAPHMTLEKLDEIVERTNRQDPDLVVLLGDYVIQGVLFGSAVAPEDIATRLARLSPRHGVYAVLGNHDWRHDGLAIRRAFEDVGIVVLDNQARALDLPEGRLWIAGLADATTRTPDVAGTLAPVPEHEPIIVLAHDPVVFFEVPPRVVATFAGHMHGGQVYLPYFGALVTPGRAPRRWAYGHIREDGKDLFVTAGLGTSILPVRFNMPPEIALLTLAAAAPAVPDVARADEPDYAPLADEREQQPWPARSSSTSTSPAPTATSPLSALMP